jgi:hypothetical protein
MIKALKKLGLKRMFFNKKKDIYDNLILNGEQLKVLLLKSGTRLGCPLAPLLFNVVLEFLAREIIQEQEILRIQIVKEKVKLYLFADDMILYLRDPKNSTKNY